MAPNISGVILSDQARVYGLAELALDFAVNHLEPDGAFLIKVFQGVGFEAYVKAMRAVFKKVATRNPDGTSAWFGNHVWD
jgi:23S rRNA (uridine2552-2'-O)-methyltransferase